MSVISMHSEIPPLPPPPISSSPKSSSRASTAVTVELFLAAVVPPTRSARGDDEDAHAEEEDDDVDDADDRCWIDWVSPPPSTVSSSYTVTDTWSAAAQLSPSHSSTSARWVLTNRSKTSTPDKSVCTATLAVFPATEGNARQSAWYCSCSCCVCPDG